MSTTQLIITDYQSHERDIRYVRDRVFLMEQQISREDEIDDRETSCLHALVYRDNIPIGTGRLDAEKDGKIGRIAVLKPHRRCGIGRLIMEGLMKTALDQGLPRIWFNAQLSAVPFYLRLGYQACSDEFEEAGIPHVRMERRLG